MSEPTAPAPRPESPRTVNSYLRGAAGAALSGFGLITVVLSGSGYLIGYASVWLFCLGVGVSPRDLGLGNQDYLLLAALWALLLLAFGVGSGVLLYGDVRYSTNLLITSYQGLVICTAVVPWPPVVGAVLLIAAVVLGGPLFFYLRRTVLGAPRLFGKIALPVVWTLVTGLVGWTSLYWGELLRENPAAARGGPISLIFVLPPTEGLVTLDSGVVCVVRLSDRVYVAEEDVLVTTEARPFRPRNCF
jgi:hypothetical protein